MANNRNHILALCVLMFSGVAFAESTSEALTRIEAETMLMKARERQLDVQANILNKQNEIALRQGVANTLPQISTGPDPVLRGIEGLGKSMYATLEIGSTVFEVRRGDVLPNGSQVISIAKNSVTLRSSSGGNLQLAVTARNGSSNVASESTGQGTGVMLPLPPLSPAMARGPTR